MNQSKVFISYSRSDGKFALQLSKDLNRNGVNVWLDQTHIEGGHIWDNEVEKALDSSSKFIIILSPNSVSSSNVKDELNSAIEDKKEIIPVLLKECKRPLRIRRHQYIDFSRDYEVGLKKLLKLFDVTHRETNSTKQFKPIPISRKNFLLMTGFGTISIFGVYWINSSNTSSIEKVDKPKKNPRFKRFKTKGNYSSNKYKNVLTINRKSEIIHYFDYKGFTLSTNNFTSLDEFNVFEENLEIFDDYGSFKKSSYIPNAKPRLPIKHSSWNAEQFSLESIKKAEFEKASDILICSIRQNINNSKTSYRLHDLLAVLYIRHSDKISNEVFKELIQVSSNSFDSELLKRTKNWSDLTWQKDILEKKRYYFNKVLI